MMRTSPETAERSLTIAPSRSVSISSSAFVCASSAYSSCTRSLMASTFFFPRRRQRWQDPHRQPDRRQRQTDRARTPQTGTHPRSTSASPPQSVAIELKLPVLRQGGAATSSSSPRNFPRCSTPPCRSTARSASPRELTERAALPLHRARRSCACSRAAARWPTAWPRTRITSATCTSTWCAPAKRSGSLAGDLRAPRPSSNARATTCATTSSPR